VALDTLQAAGGWTSGSSQPGVSAEEEGVRRAICDMALLTFHLVISALMYVSPRMLNFVASASLTAMSSLRKGQ
jgi:hypothetical protein